MLRLIYALIQPRFLGPEEGGGGAPEASSETDDRREAIAGALAEQEKESEAQTEQAEQAETALEPPDHWDPDVRERFRTADPEWQKWLVERDKAIADQRDQHEQRWAPFQRAVDPWNGYLQKINADPGAMLNHLMPFEFALPDRIAGAEVGRAQQLAQQYGVQAPNPPPDEKTQQAQDPLGIRRDIMANVSPLMESQQQLAQQIQQMQQQAAQSQTASMQDELVSFRDAKDEKGKTRNPYFNELLPDMMELAENETARGRKPTILDLYTKAMRLNEGVWKKVQNDEAAQKKQAEKDQMQPVGSPAAAAAEVQNRKGAENS